MSRSGIKDESVVFYKNGENISALLAHSRLSLSNESRAQVNENWNTQPAGVEKYSMRNCPKPLASVTSLLVTAGRDVDKN